MLGNFINFLVPIICLLAGFLPIVILATMWRQRDRDRRSPLTRDLLRPPGMRLK
jgi:hypothetical protein